MLVLADSPASHFSPFVVKSVSVKYVSSDPSQQNHGDIKDVFDTRRA